MATVIDICNGALSQIGASVITSLSEDSKNAEVCNQRYAPVKDAVLRSHPWNCAVTRVTLTPTGTEPDFEFANAFAIPSDCLRLLNLSYLDIPHRLERNQILCDEATIEVMYVADVDPSFWDALLLESVTAALAADIAYAIVGSTSLADYYRALYADKLKEARFVDATEGTPASIDSVAAAGSLESDVFIRSRY